MEDIEINKIVKKLMMHRDILAEGLAEIKGRVDEIGQGKIKVNDFVIEIDNHVQDTLTRLKYLDNM